MPSADIYNPGYAPSRPRNRADSTSNVEEAYLHSSDAAIRGHVFCSFLALTLRKEQEDRLQTAGLQLEWQDVLGDLDRLVETTVESEDRRFVLRNQAPGCDGALFQAVGVALPPLFRRLDAEKPDVSSGRPPAAKSRKRPLTPRNRSATRKTKT